MKHEVFHDILAPCIRASETSVAWKPLITSSKFATMILVRSFLKKVLIRTEFRGTFCFVQKLAQWAKNNGDF